MAGKKICYVIMPFSKTQTTSKAKWKKMYTEIFRPIIEKSPFGYECKRSGLDHGSFTKDIILNLRDAYLVLADITDLNANVMWELGVRHSLSKRTIIVAREDFIPQIPSDIAEYVTIPYEFGLTGYPKFEGMINDLLQKIEDDPEKSDSPVFNFIKEEELILSSYGRKQIINKLIGLMTEIGENLELANEISSGTTELGRKDELVTSKRYNLEALEKLLTENYVNGGANYTRLLQAVREWSKATNGRLDILATTNYLHRMQIIDIIIIDATTLKEYLTKLMHISRDLYNSVKSNSLIDVEPSIIISDELKKEFFE